MKTKIYDVYHPWNISLKKATGCTIEDENGKQYLDCYGGHGVISIGHDHPTWKNALIDQMNKISYYSNALKIKEQEQVSSLFAEVSGLNNYKLFLCNSGAEANENAMKIAAFKTGRNKILSFEGAFHGRTVGAIAVTDNPKIVAPFGESLSQKKIAFEDFVSLEEELLSNQYAAVIIEGIQGVAGVFEASTDFWKKLRTLCTMTDTLLIADEIQSGCGRTGDFFAFQKHGIEPDLITMAKGIGNGFPVAGVLVQDEIEAVKGQLGTTFGGSYLACAAVKAVLETIQKEQLIENAETLGTWSCTKLKAFSFVEEVRGRGLMIGIKTKIKAVDLQLQLLEKGVVTGTSTCPFTLRILPPLNITKEELETFLNMFRELYTFALKEDEGGWPHFSIFPQAESCAHPKSEAL